MMSPDSDSELWVLEKILATCGSVVGYCRDPHDAKLLHVSVLAARSPSPRGYDDPRPVTPEWLLSIGAEEGKPNDRGRTFILEDQISLYFWSDMPPDAELCGGGKVAWETVGEFRRLCDSLKIEIDRSK